MTDPPFTVDAGEPATGDGMRILFVDDEPDVLDSLRDALRRYRRVWRMSFATGGELALAALDAEPADVVVSDMLMPGMDGATLLAEIQQRHPATIRIVLSGYANPQVVARAATVAHRFLAKPCKVDELSWLIDRSLALHELTKQAELYRVTATTTTLPSRPGLYMELTEAIADPRTSPDDIAGVIERDTAMTAKLLQLANSAFFGTGRGVSSIRAAVVNLGTDTIRALTLSAEAFGKLKPVGVDRFSIEEFQQHASLTAAIAAKIMPRGLGEHDAVAAALMHDIGELVMVCEDPARWQRLSEEAERRELALHEIEREREGVTHAAIGAYLLSLWGLPDGVVEAVAHHHNPAGLPGTPSLDAVAAVHIADALANEIHPRSIEGGTCATLVDAYVEQLGALAQLDGWRTLAAERSRRLCGEAGS
jgi:HD-like signal output (HDOD) protein/ActR/RegA family two-component response regulator